MYILTRIKSKRKNIIEQFKTLSYIYIMVNVKHTGVKKKKDTVSHLYQASPVDFLEIKSIAACLATEAASRILNSLINLPSGEEVYQTEFGKTCPVAQQTISYTLPKFEKWGFVKTRKQSKYCFITFDREKFEQFERIFLTIINFNK